MEMDIDKIMSLLPTAPLPPPCARDRAGLYGRELSLLFCPLVHLSQSVPIHTAYSPGVMWFCHPLVLSCRLILIFV